MADDQHEEQTPPPMALEQSALNNDMVQMVRELLYKDKNTALVKAVELLVLNVQQQQVILMLKQTLQEAILQTDQMLKDLHDQPVMESLLSNIETQNQSTRKQLADKVESIRMHMKANEVLRKQLKKELMGFRSAIDDIKRDMHEKEETGKLLFRALSDVKAVAEEGQKKLNSIAAARAKQREEFQASLEHLRNQKSSSEENVRKMKMEFAEREKELNQFQAELEKLKRQLNENIQLCHQLVSDNIAVQQRNAKLVQQIQNEMHQLEQNYEEKKILLDRLFVEKSNEYKQNIEELDRKIGDAMNRNAEQAKQAAETEAEVSKIADELDDVNNENIKLEKELALAKLKPTVEGSGDSSKNKPNNFLYGTRVIARAREPKWVAAHGASSTDNEFDQSYHLDNEQSFTTVESKNGKM